MAVELQDNAGYSVGDVRDSMVAIFGGKKRRSSGVYCENPGGDYIVEVEAESFRSRR